MSGPTGAGDFYRQGHRSLQEHFGTRRLADRLTEVTVAETFSNRDRRFIERAPFFWLATADADGWPEVSYKGGRPGFVAVIDDRHLRFPSYDGNGMYRSMGNISDTDRVGLLFCDFERPKRLRIRGRATLIDDPDVVADWPGAELVVEVRVGQLFFNCPRYLHTMTLDELSEFAPAEGYRPPEPEWKGLDVFADVMPEST